MIIKNIIILFRKRRWRAYNFGKDLINDLKIEINENKINIKNEDFIVKVVDD